MAPPLRTYGKKKSLLGPLGSRHRSKASTDFLPAKNPDLGSQSVNPCSDTAKRHSRTQSNAQPTSIEEIASALLDDSSSELPADGDAKGQLVQDDPDCTTSIPPVREDSTPEVGEQPIISHSPKSLKEGSTSNSRAPRPSAPRIQKMSPNNRFAKSSRPRGNSTSSPKRKDYSLIRPLADSVKKSTHRSPYPVVKDAEAVCLLPHNVMDRTPRILLQSELAGQGRAVATSADEIQEKVCAMLAATDALKPCPSQPRKSPVSKMTRMTPSRVLAKVSSAWDRWQVRSSSGGAAKPRARLTKQPVQEDSPDGPLTSHPVFVSPAFKRASLIDTIEIRLNEGDNLNRKKVQQMVGGCVARKPVANDGKALRSGRSLDDDPFAEPALYHSPSAIERHQHLKIMVGSNTASLLIIDPFEAEKGFENNLEDRILSSSPVCASTPRIHLHRVQTPTLEDSLDEQCSKLPTQISLEKGTTDLTIYQSQEAISFKKSPNQSGQMRVLPNTDRITVGLIREGPSLDTCSAKWSKKHPSPSKRDLEQLEIAFRCYSELKRRGIGEEADELAAHYTPSTRYLSPRDTNRMMKAREEGVKSMSSSESQSPAKSQIRRPTDDLRRHHQIRLAPVYRPTIPQSDEVDELQ
ncbi:hypothetical protein THAR02_08006 [Trichoderma harzianum]|uniref:Uncharacterized protein n=1 Tax=Trichoderma harzianum TaxID=5544 RepID=A0A0F9X5M8_TRIHA|nr:hypothetical protein THAR02_08006 [Trichoderma harzianum]